MKHLLIFGLAAGAIIAVGLLTSAQWHAIGAALGFVAIRYGVIAIPWLLTALFGRLWWHERRRAALYGDIAITEQEERQRANAQLWTIKRALEQPAQRTRARR